MMADPGYDYGLLKERILAQHTDLLTAANSVTQGPLQPAARRSDADPGRVA